MRKKNHSIKCNQFFFFFFASTFLIIYIIQIISDITQSHLTFVQNSYGITKFDISQKINKQFRLYDLYIFPKPFTGSSGKKMQCYMTCFSSEMIIHISTTNQKFQMNVNQSKVPNECHVISTWFSTETQIFKFFRNRSRQWNLNSVVHCQA